MSDQPRAGDVISQYTDEWRERYGTPYPTLPEWASELERELVRADVADWTGGRRPHPSNIALVVVRFLKDQGIEVPDGD